RRIVEILGGTFEGPEIKGRVVPGGADWQMIQPDGFSELDTRYSLETDQGEIIYVQNFGIRHAPPEVMQRLNAGESVDPSLVYFRTMPRFETSSLRLQWLVRSVFIGTGERYPDAVQIQCWRVEQAGRRRSTPAADEIYVDREALRQRRVPFRPTPRRARQHAQERLVVRADTVPLDDLEPVALGELETLGERHRRELLAGDPGFRGEQHARAVAVPVHVEQQPRIAVLQRRREERHRVVPQRRLRVQEEPERRDEIELPSGE